MKKTLFLITCAMACSMASAQFSFYNSPGTWDAGRASAGYTVFYGAEDFEQSILPANDVDGFDDSLVTGNPNNPDGFPFPNGLLHPGMTIQSNLDPLGMTLNPRGVDGLAAASIGFAGIVSDVVLANTFVDSFDIIFAPGVNAAGFDVLDLFGGQVVTIKVFDAANILMGTTNSPGDASGANFLGITSSTAIGRINMFSIGNGAEGMDNMNTYNVVPEPATMIALGLGLAALLRRRRRKNA